ncbi:ATP-binding cassette domain-containing protein [Tsukamurella sp. 8F]|uniref:ATP-binding cassette domain-containing protein n=1 Tax=unclassified Tsukamurella TaxID=2633480 RepID=UPI0023B8FDD4|nr:MULTISPECIES: ATP-binding cassette domain-containing protein [unclassified Tsukamurella]MDF0531946.1 ATP-binding cassette domain-containing protein [Tsukamurella sp. 8J]MDF0588003.1 ATP-binding cassette domain-containing protein [Tsukamurella sp. 8F]
MRDRRSSLARIVARVVCLTLLGLVLVAPLLAPHDPSLPVTEPFGPPGPGAPLGGDELGRDVLSRFLVGGAGITALCLVLAVVLTGVSLLVGVVAALRPRLGSVVSAVATVIILLPPVLGMLVLLVAFPDLHLIGFALVALLFGTPYCVVVFHAAADGLAHTGYVEVAVNNGESMWGLAWREVAPNLRDTALEQFVIRFVSCVYMVSTAVFLGLTGALGDVNWASMTRSAVGAGLGLNPWAAVAPVAGIVGITVAVRLLVVRRAAPRRRTSAPLPASSEAVDAAESGVHVADLCLRTPDGVERRYDLDAEPATVTLLTGPSGSGKTLLLSALVGEVAPQVDCLRGEVAVGGGAPLALAGTELRRLRRTRVTLVGQDAGLALPVATRVRSLLAAPLAAEAAATLGVPEAAFERRAGELSGGERRRVAVARAVGRDTPVLLLDEPFAGLDRARADALVALLRSRADAGRTVVVSGHDVDYLALHADGVVDVTGASRSGRADYAPARDAAPGDAVLTARGLTVRRRRAAVVADADLDVPAGVLTALVGESGAGKTTLARALAGFADGTTVAGRIELDGKVLSARRPAAVRRLIQVIPQDPLASLQPRRTVGASIARVAMLAGAPSGDDAVTALLARVGLEPDLAARSPNELSGGQRQRASVARALAARPRVLLCDEVTSALDYAAAEQVMTCLTELARADGIGIVVISHDADLVDRYCALGYRVSDGAVVSLGDSAPALP